MSLNRLVHWKVAFQSLTEDEISKAISPLNSIKSTGPNSIPNKILKFLQVQISKHLTLIKKLTNV